MDSTVISALISGGLALIGTFGGIVASSKLMTYRIEQLEKEVAKHNSVVDRVYRLEQGNAVQDEEIKEINHRIGELEKCKNYAKS